MSQPNRTLLWMLAFLALLVAGCVLLIGPLQASLVCGLAAATI